MEKYLPYAGILAGPLALIFIWTFVSFISSIIGGWRALSGDFAAGGPVSGETHSFQSGRLRIINYNGMLKIVLADRGLYLAVFFLFRPFHPPLLVPWTAITNVREHRLFIFRYVAFDLKSQGRTLTVMISRHIADSPRWKAEKPS